MLWCMDAGRPLLFFPELNCFWSECLGDARTSGVVSSAFFRTLPADHRSALVRKPGAQRRWQETVCECVAGPRRTRPLRPQVQAIRTISCGDIGGRTGVLAGWQVDHLCFLSRSHTLAQPRGRQRSPATNLSAGLGRAASLVSRRNPDRLRGWPGRPLQTFLIPAQGGAPQQMLAENQPQLDAPWSPEGKKIAFGRNGASGSE